MNETVTAGTGFCDVCGAALNAGMCFACPNRAERGNVCEHGSLARACRVCELEAEVARLTAACDGMRALLSRWGLERDEASVARAALEAGLARLREALHDAEDEANEKIPPEDVRRLVEQAVAVAWEEGVRWAGEVLGEEVVWRPEARSACLERIAALLREGEE